MNMKHMLFLISVAVLFAFFMVEQTLGCPNCKDGFSTADPDAANVARGYFYSILLMLAMPFTLIGSFSAYVWREMRRQKRSELSQDPSVQ
jgi:heme/copper-type cytochrome/quinol oxidase subunit 2